VYQVFAATLIHRAAVAEMTQGQEEWSGYPPAGLGVYCRARGLVDCAVAKRPGRVDFSRLTHELVARFKEIWQKQGVSTSIEMLDAFRYGKINKPLTHSATEKSTSPLGLGKFRT
jgi:hypothetical protein